MKTAFFHLHGLNPYLCQGLPVSFWCGSLWVIFKDGQCILKNCNLRNNERLGSRLVASCLSSSMSSEYSMDLIPLLDHNHTDFHLWLGVHSSHPIEYLAKQGHKQWQVAVYVWSEGQKVESLLIYPKTIVFPTLLLLVSIHEGLGHSFCLCVCVCFLASLLDILMQTAIDLIVQFLVTKDLHNCLWTQALGQPLEKPSTMPHPPCHPGPRPNVSWLG